MTRINYGIPVETLSNQHLIAEHREIKRIPNCVGKGKFSMSNQPKEFKLGTGHVKFFYDKLGYLLNRYCKIYDECIKRGFNVQCYIDAWNNIPDKFMNDSNPTEKDIEIVKQRIKERS